MVAANSVCHLHFHLLKANVMGENILNWVSLSSNLWFRQLKARGRCSSWQTNTPAGLRCQVSGNCLSALSLFLQLPPAPSTPQTGVLGTGSLLLEVGKALILRHFLLRHSGEHPFNFVFWMPPLPQCWLALWGCPHPWAQLCFYS